MARRSRVESVKRGMWVGFRRGTETAGILVAGFELKNTLMKERTDRNHANNVNSALLEPCERYQHNRSHCRLPYYEYHHSIQYV